MIKDEQIKLNIIKLNKQHRNNSFIRARIADLIYLIKIINLKIILLYFTGFHIYLYSLTPIKGVGMRCFRWKGVQCYYSLAILIFISSIFISVSIFLTINLKYSKIHLVLISIISVGLFLIDHND